MYIVSKDKNLAQVQGQRMNKLFVSHITQVMLGLACTTRRNHVLSADRRFGGSKEGSEWSTGVQIFDLRGISPFI